MEQEIRFCKAPDGVRIAYSKAGRGPPLLKVANYISHLEHDWTSPVWRPFLDLLTENHQLYRYDERGTGLSDWDAEDLSFEAWVGDLETVADAIGPEKVDLVAMSQAGAVAVAYAARHPERVNRLVVLGSYARGWLHRDLDDGKAEEERLWISLMKVGWGQDNPAFRQFFTTQLSPDASKEHLDSLNEVMRISARPDVAARLEEVMHGVNVVDLAPTVCCPTLVMHARQDNCVPFDEGMFLASLIPDSRFVALESRNHILTEAEPAWPKFAEALQSFLGTGGTPRKTTRKTDWRLATILFTDIAGSTELAAKHGDRWWLEKLDAHNVMVRELLDGFSGQEIKTTGDGFAILFDGPVNAIQCALKITNAVQELGIQVRCGIHIGEIEVGENDIGGIGVHIAARLLAHTRPDSVVVTGTVKDASVGTGIEFDQRRTRALKGVPGKWTLYNVVAPTTPLMS